MVLPTSAANPDMRINGIGQLRFMLLEAAGLLQATVNPEEPATAMEFEVATGNFTHPVDYELLAEYRASVRAHFGGDGGDERDSAPSHPPLYDDLPSQAQHSQRRSWAARSPARSPARSAPSTSTSPPPTDEIAGGIPRRVASGLKQHV